MCFSIIPYNKFQNIICIKMYSLEVINFLITSLVVVCITVFDVFMEFLIIDRNPPN